MSDALISDSVTPSLLDRTEKPPLLELKQSIKDADQQAKFLHLKAEVEGLWQQVQRSRNHNDNN